MKYLILLSRILIPIFIWISFYLLNENLLNFDNGILNFIYYVFVTVIVVSVSIKINKMNKINNK